MRRSSVARDVKMPRHPADPGRRAGPSEFRRPVSRAPDDRMSMTPFAPAAAVRLLSLRTRRRWPLALHHALPVVTTLLVLLSLAPAAWLASQTVRQQQARVSAAERAREGLAQARITLPLMMLVSGGASTDRLASYDEGMVRLAQAQRAQGAALGTADAHAKLLRAGLESAGSTGADLRLPALTALLRATAGGAGLAHDADGTVRLLAAAGLQTVPALMEAVATAHAGGMSAAGARRRADDPLARVALLRESLLRDVEQLRATQPAAVAGLPLDAALAALDVWAAPRLRELRGDDALEPMTPVTPSVGTVGAMAALQQVGVSLLDRLDLRLAARLDDEADRRDAMLLALLPALVVPPAALVWLRRRVARPAAPAADEAAATSVPPNAAAVAPPAATSPEVSPREMVSLTDTLSKMQRALRRIAAEMHDASGRVAGAGTVWLDGPGAHDDRLAQALGATVQRFGDASVRLGELVESIDTVAFQTHVLALQATVDAGRPVDPGRGLAVVAGEVRVLARRSADAAREMRSLITDSMVVFGDRPAWTLDPSAPGLDRPHAVAQALTEQVDAAADALRRQSLALANEATRVRQPVADSF